MSHLHHHTHIPFVLTKKNKYLLKLQKNVKIETRNNGLERVRA